MQSIKSCIKERFLNVETVKTDLILIGNHLRAAVSGTEKINETIFSACTLVRPWQTIHTKLIPKWNTNVDDGPCAKFCTRFKICVQVTAFTIVGIIYTPSAAIGHLSAATICSVLATTSFFTGVKFFDTNTTYKFIVYTITMAASTVGIACVGMISHGTFFLALGIHTSMFVHILMPVALWRYTCDDLLTRKTPKKKKIKKRTPCDRLQFSQKPFSNK